MEWIRDLSTNSQWNSEDAICRLQVKTILKRLQKETTQRRKKIRNKPTLIDEDAHLPSGIFLSKLHLSKFIFFCKLQITPSALKTTVQY